jgi:hypothetical protein
MKELSKPETDAVKPLDTGLAAAAQRRRPGRGIGEKRLTQQELTRLNVIFENLQEVRKCLTQHGHPIINQSGSLLASQAHQNLDQLVALLEDFLWVLNCAIARQGGMPKLV